MVYLLGNWACIPNRIRGVNGYMAVAISKWDAPNQRLVARVVDYHLDSQCIVDVHEEGVCLISVEPHGIHLCQGINERCEILVLAAITDNVW